MVDNYFWRGCYLQSDRSLFWVDVMQKTFRCKKYDHIFMRKRCIERQEQGPEYIEKKAIYPQCTKRCKQGQKIRKELGDKIMTIKKNECSEEGCTALPLAKGLCHSHYQAKYREEKKGENLTEKKPMPLLNDLKKEVNDTEEDYQPNPSLNEVLDEMKLTPDPSNDAEHGPEFIDVNISFKDHPELKAYLEANAKRDFRTVQGQIMYMLDCSYQVRKRKADKKA